MAEQAALLRGAGDLGGNDAARSIPRCWPKAVKSPELWHDGGWKSAIGTLRSQHAYRHA